MMKRSERLYVALPPLVLVAVVQCCLFSLLPNLTTDPHCLEAPYAAPPATFEASDLVDTWQTDYGRGRDTVIIKADGTFKQSYQDDHVEDYLYETPWNEWWVEGLPGGGVRLHLAGARYYLRGIAIAERDGLEGAPYDGFWGESGPPPFLFYDPIADELVEMVGELILEVRATSSGELLLVHMWTGTKRGFAAFGCQAEQFRRVRSP